MIRRKKGWLAGLIWLGTLAMVLAPGGSFAQTDLQNIADQIKKDTLAPTPATGPAGPAGPAGPKASGPTDSEKKKFAEAWRTAEKLATRGRAHQDETQLERALAQYSRLLEMAEKQDYGAQAEARLNHIVASIHWELFLLTDVQAHKTKAIDHFVKAKRLLENAPKGQRAVLQWFEIREIGEKLKKLRR